MCLYYNLSLLHWSFPSSGSFACFLMDYTYDPAFKCFLSSGFLLGLNKGGLAVRNQLTAVQDIGLEWAPSLQRDEPWKVNYLHLQWSLWQSSESLDGMPCRKLTLSFPALLSWLSRVPIFRTVMPAIADSQSAAPPIPVWIGQQISWEVNFLSQLCLQEKCCSFGIKIQSESSAAWNYIPYVLNLQPPDVPRNECDEDFILFRVICSSPA